MKKIVIFLNGKHTKSVLQVQTQATTFPFLYKSDKQTCDNTVVFAADNGFKRVLSEKLRYSKLYLFGDFDSLSSCHLKKAKTSKNIEVNIFPTQKCVSDFACILDHIRSHFSTEDPFLIEIYGGLGHARDHEYANIREAEHFLEHAKQGGTIVFQGNVVLSTQSFVIPPQYTRKKYFSIFCSSKCEFTLQNALYSGTLSLTRPSYGLSNSMMPQLPLLVERHGVSRDVMTLIVR